MQSSSLVQNRKALQISENCVITHQKLYRKPESLKVSKTLQMNCHGLIFNALAV